MHTDYSQFSYKILKSNLRKPLSEIVSYLKSCRDMGCNHKTSVGIVFDEVFVKFNLFGRIMLYSFISNAHD